MAMKDSNDTTRGRVDGLLRQWGAAEASSLAEAELSAPQAAGPVAAPQPGRSRAGVFLRWVPAGLAASLLLAAGVLFMESRNADKYSAAPVIQDDFAPRIPQTRPAGDAAVKLAEARAEIAEARRQAAETRTELAQLLAQKQTDDRKIRELVGKLKASDDELKAKEDKLASERADWKVMEAKLSSLISKAEQSAGQARDRLDAVRKQLADARAAGADRPAADPAEVRKLKARLAVAVEEIKRQRIAFDSANADRDEAKHALAAVKTARSARLDQVRRVYLAAAAPNKTGLAALQEAMKNRRLLARCAALQRKVRTDADKKLLGRTEVVLTRLGLLDLSNSSAVSKFAVQLDRSGLIASLDAARGPMVADAGAGDWLFEAKLILTGVQRVT